MHFLIVLRTASPARQAWSMGFLKVNSAGAVHGFPVFALDGTDGRHERHGQAAVLLEEDDRVGLTLSLALRHTSGYNRTG